MNIFAKISILLCLIETIVMSTVSFDDNLDDETLRVEF